MIDFTFTHSHDSEKELKDTKHSQKESQAKGPDTNEKQLPQEASLSQTASTRCAHKNRLAKDWVRQGFGQTRTQKSFRGMSQSTQSLIRALSFLYEIGQLQGKALFIGDRPEHALLFHEYLSKTPHSYLSCGWVPGLLTNASQHECTQQAHQILASIMRDRPRALRGRAAKIFESREHIYAHLNDLKPDVIIFLGEEDHRSGALQECQKLQIPTVALCRTPAWSSQVTYPVFFQTSVQIVHKLTKLYKNALSGEYIP